MKTSNVCLRYLLRRAAVGLGLIVVVSGCAPSGSVRLIQPHYAGQEQDLYLTCDDVCWSPAGDVDRYLAEFPLPGATTGRPTYLLYLRTVADSDDSTDRSGQWQPVEGFLIQTRGQNAGLEVISNGSARFASPPRRSDDQRRFEVDVRCEFGSRIVGTLTAFRDDSYLEHFENERYPADVQALSAEDWNSPPRDGGEAVP